MLRTRRRDHKGQPIVHTRSESAECRSLLDVGDLAGSAARDILTRLREITDECA
jgi:hypothetical protein